MVSKLNPLCFAEEIAQEIKEKQDPKFLID